MKMLRLSGKSLETVSTCNYLVLTLISRQYRVPCFRNQFEEATYYTRSLSRQVIRRTPTFIGNHRNF
jgi:hypothetical protein